jgi:ribosomal protein L37AE/L43A
MSENQELKPCPFCGGEPLYELNSEDDKIIVCQKCGAGTAPSVWNTRYNEAPTGETQELIERINDTLKYYEKWYKMAGGGLIELPAGCLSVNIEVLNYCKTQLTAQADEIKRLREGLEIANRCIDNGDLILKGSAYDTIIKQVLNEKI